MGNRPVRVAHALVGHRLPFSFVPRPGPHLSKTANRRGFSLMVCPRMLAPTDTKCRDSLCGSWVWAVAERAGAARKQADKTACEGWTKRACSPSGADAPSPTLGNALNAGYLYLEARCLGCDTHQTGALSGGGALKSNTLLRRFQAIDLVQRLAGFETCKCSFGGRRTHNADGILQGEKYMAKVKDSDLFIGPGRSLIVVDDQLLTLLEQFVAMGLAASWEVRINEPIEYEYTATKLMQRLAKTIHVQTNR
jgi:hypothetical protein